jgi:hypothetical protein
MYGSDHRNRKRISSVFPSSPDLIVRRMDTLKFHTSHKQKKEKRNGKDRKEKEKKSY